MKHTRKTPQCFQIAIFLVFGFWFKVLLDYKAYTSMLTAVPFYLRVLIDIILFLVPALIFTIIGIVQKKKRHSDPFRKC